MSSVPKTQSFLEKINGFFNSSNTSNTTQNSYPFSFIFSLIIMVFLIIMTSSLLYSKGDTSSYLLFITTCFASLVIIFASFKFNGFFRDLLAGLGNSINVVFIITYIIGLIMMYTLLSKDDTDKYAYIILPSTILFGCYLFYNAFSNFINSDTFNLNWERINYFITIFCLFIFISIFYITDPGGYISKNFGISLIFSILLGSLGLLYLITMMTSIKGKNNSTPLNIPTFLGFNIYTIISIIALIVFVSLILPGVLSYPDIFTKKSIYISSIFSMIMLIFVFWIISFISGIFAGVTPNAETNEYVKKNIFNYNSIVQKILMVLSGFTISGILIYWLVSLFQSFTNKSSIFSIFVNILIVLVILYIVFKLLSNNTLYKDSPFLKILVNTFLYIPCLIFSLFDKIASVYYSNSPNKSFIDANFSIEKTPPVYYLLLIIIIFIYILYFSIPQFKRLFSEQGGMVLINMPVNLNNEYILSSYQILNKSEIEKFNYKYAISFWTFIDSANPSSNESYNKYTSILNYGGKPNVQYNAHLNKLRITMSISDDFKRSNIPKILDDDGNVILYEKSDILLQKWNHIIINYNGGTLDVFYNGHLVKSITQVVPYMSYDNLSVGATRGIHGGICNVNYFNHELNINEINNLYNSVKDQTPPVLMSDNITFVNNIYAEWAKINGLSTIMSDIPPASPDETSSNKKDIFKRLTPNKNAETDYLSLKWYFTGNGDNYNYGN